MSVDVATWTGILVVSAHCECGWASEAKNALANAKRHAAAHGHVVRVEQVLGVTYAPREMSKDEVFSPRHYP